MASTRHRKGSRNSWRSASPNGTGVETDGLRFTLLKSEHLTNTIQRQLTDDEHTGVNGRPRLAYLLWPTWHEPLPTTRQTAPHHLKEARNAKNQRYEGDVDLS